ncbi:hypothetical protein LUZ60_006200 [Juncus effusus]|nr:hypothetical protein LUZ60_006200 [Juncus effusus]
MKKWLSVLGRRRSTSSSGADETRGSTTVVSSSSIIAQSEADPHRNLPNSTPSETKETQADSQMENIITNHDFSQGLNSWNPNSCHLSIASDDSTYKNGIRPNCGGNYVIVTQRSQTWQGLEQDVTDKIAPDVKYEISSFVRVCGEIHESTIVQATLKLENHDNSTNFLCIGRVSVSKEKWEKLEGSFALKTVPKRVVFYLEGPPPGVDLLIDSVSVSYKKEENVNIISNYDFSDGIKAWRPNNCHAYVASDWSGQVSGIQGHFGNNYAVATKRTQNWQGLEQDITAKVKPGVQYYVFALVRVFGENVGDHVDVTATVRLEGFGGEIDYLFVNKVSAGKERWEKLEGSFALKSVHKSVVFYLEGPPAGVDLLIDCVKITNFNPSTQSPVTEQKPVPQTSQSQHNYASSLTQNPNFETGLASWTGRGCKIFLNTDFAPVRNIRALTNNYFAVATERRDTWQGIQQDITSKMQRKALYSVKTAVRIVGSSRNSEVRVTLWYKGKNGREEFKGIAKGQVSDQDWTELEGKLLVFNEIEQAIIFLEAPPAGTDILVNHFAVFPFTKPLSTRPPSLQNIQHGVNIIQNHDLTHELKHWAPLGNCQLSVKTETLNHETLKGRYRYIHCTSRTATWMGPSQQITRHLKRHVTYQVHCHVRLGPGPSRSFQKVNVALNVDDQWVNGGTVEAGSDSWREVRGSFRLEREVDKVVVYVQGPEAGVDLKVMGLRVLECDRRNRFEYLKEKTDKVRKRDVVLRFHGPNNVNLEGLSVKVTQKYNSFPFGTCIGRYNIDHEDLADFFVKNFNWAVFENELKWYWTEAEKGKINYHDSDYLLQFCERNNKKVRGHCIFWEVEDSVQPWLKTLDNNELMKNVDNRLKSLLSRYKGRFMHHDVNNEMLHGSFYKDKLGDEIWAYMFREAHKLDPNAILFVNDYNVEDGCDPKSTPEKYIEQILDLNEKGAKVGGIGVQGHITNPIGEIICDSLDKLGILGLPIWITELDVVSENEFVRADDLEVVLRECFAHENVEGIVFWGFWELFMWRENGHLVDANGRVNEAGKRFLDLKREWMTGFESRTFGGEFGFRGFCGGYKVEVNGVVREFVVEKGEGTLVLDIKI